MKQIILILLTILLSTPVFSQTEEEKRAIIAAKNKIQSDSLSLESRSMRVRECKKQNEVLLEALENAYKTIELQNRLDEVLTTDLEVCKDSLQTTKAELEVQTQKAGKEERRKKTWRKIALGAVGVAIIETAIIILL